MSARGHEREYIFTMKSVHTWRYSVSATSLAEAARFVLGNKNPRTDKYEDFAQDEVGATTLPGTARLIEIKGDLR